MWAMDVELLEIRDFLAQQAPFDTLPRDVLDALPRQCTLRYARRGTVVLDVGEEGAGLYVVRSGAVDVVDEAGGLIERVGTGGGFGMSWLLEHRPTRYRSTATEDTLLLVLPAESFHALVRDHPGFETFFAATHHNRLSKAIANLQQAASGTTVLSTRVQELISAEPTTTRPDATIAEAAAAMSRAGVSSIIVTDETGVRGIVTDRDLRNRVLAAGLDPRRPVREVMTSPAFTLRDDALAFEAMLEMVSRRIHHLPVVDDHGWASGVVTTADLLRLENSNPVYLAADIGRQATVPGVVKLAHRIPSVLADLVDRDASAGDISQIVSALGDAVRRRIVALVEAELGPPPVPYSWVVLGSVAREEEALAADQDHALILGEPGHDEWFSRLASRVTDLLEDSGWPRCPGDVMATNPRWRVTVDGWRRQFALWSREPEPDAVLDVAISYDLRHLFGEPRLTEAVRRASSSYVSERLLGYLSAQALRTRPPLGFFRGFVLEHAGEHGETLDLKRGIAAVVQLARVYALRAGSSALSTRSRITAAEEAGILDESTAADLRDALELMSYWRLRQQARQFRDGVRPDNCIAPADLTEHQRRHLKDAFAIVRSVQQQMAHRLGPVYS
jgi:CBS domain-containing protein